MCFKYLDLPIHRHSQKSSGGIWLPQLYNCSFLQLQPSQVQQWIECSSLWSYIQDGGNILNSSELSFGFSISHLVLNPSPISTISFSFAKTFLLFHELGFALQSIFGFLFFFSFIFFISPHSCFLYHFLFFLFLFFFFFSSSSFFPF